MPRYPWNAPIQLTPEHANKFWSLVDRTPNSPGGCWEWTAGKNAQGYGCFSRGKNFPQVRASRVAYTLCVGPVPDGLFMCHRCDNPPCCNPAHLYVGTYVENNRDTLARGRRNDRWNTHCHRGHPMTPDNTYVTRGGKGRRCRACTLAFNQASDFRHGRRKAVPNTAA